MSAAEVIELIKKLPPEEQAKVFAFGDEAREQGGDVVRQANRDKAREVARQVFDRHSELFRKLAQ